VFWVRVRDNVARNGRGRLDSAPVTRRRQEDHVRQELIGLQFQ